MIVVLILSEVARGGFQRVIDRQFFREKYKFDQAMQKMRLAVGSLVDRVTLGSRLLEGAVQVLRLEWGALYVYEPSEKAFQLVASHGPAVEQANRWLWTIPSWPGFGRPRRRGSPMRWRPVAQLRSRHRRHDRPGGRSTTASGAAASSRAC